jgi:hypothetical protein
MAATPLSGAAQRGRVIASRDLEVLGEVPAAGRSYFCVPEPVGAATYRLSVTGAGALQRREHGNAPLVAWNTTSPCSWLTVPDQLPALA